MRWLGGRSVRPPSPPDIGRHEAGLGLTGEPRPRLPRAAGAELTPGRRSAPRVHRAPPGQQEASWARCRRGNSDCRVAGHLSPRLGAPSPSAESVGAALPRAVRKATGSARRLPSADAALPSVQDLHSAHTLRAPSFCALLPTPLGEGFPLDFGTNRLRLLFSQWGRELQDDSRDAEPELAAVIRAQASSPPAFSAGVSLRSWRPWSFPRVSPAQARLGDTRASQSDQKFRECEMEKSRHVLLTRRLQDPRAELAGTTHYFLGRAPVPTLVRDFHGATAPTSGQLCFSASRELRGAPTGSSILQHLIKSQF